MNKKNLFVDNRYKNIYYLKKRNKRKKHIIIKPKRVYLKIFGKLLLIIILSIILIIILLKLQINYFKVENIENTTLIKNHTKVCMCSIAKRENLYIKFYLDYYIKLGYDHIYLYDNNNKDEEKIEDVLKDYKNKDYVTLINYRGYRGPRNNPQMEAYYECYEKHYKEYDWLSFFDLDEILVIKPEGISIQNFLDNERYINCPNIKINWQVYSDNGQIKYEAKPLNERFTKRSRVGGSKTIKSIMRGNINYKKHAKTYNPHYLYLNVKSCSSSGKFVKGFCFLYPPDYEYASLHHYTKTVSEFIEKMKKGIATGNLYLDNGALKGYFDTFFRINEKTEEKVKIYNKAFNTSFH